MQKRFTAGRTKREPMAEPTKMQYTDQELLDMRPAKDAGPDKWREYHRTLFEAGKLTPPEPAKTD